LARCVVGSRQHSLYAGGGGNVATAEGRGGSNDDERSVDWDEVRSYGGGGTAQTTHNRRIRSEYPAV
jgi:hypothetical protein